VDKGAHDQVYYPEPDGTICEMNRPWVNPFWSLRAFWQAARRGRAGFHISDADYTAQTPRAVDGGSFVGQFVSRAAVARAGLPDASLFLYGDDVSFTLGVRRAGGRVGFDPALRFDHDCRTGYRTDDGRVRPMWKLYYLFRNRLMVYFRAAGPVFIWPMLVLILPGWWRKGQDYSDDRALYRRIGNGASARDPSRSESARPA